jgi:hypothetical protein
MSPSEGLKRPLLDALRTNNSNLKGERRLTKSQADVSKYQTTEFSLNHFEPGPSLVTTIKSPVQFSRFTSNLRHMGCSIICMDGSGPMVVRCRNSRCSI